MELVESETSRTARENENRTWERHERRAGLGNSVKFGPAALVARYRCLKKVLGYTQLPVWRGMRWRSVLRPSKLRGRWRHLGEGIY